MIKKTLKDKNEKYFSYRLIKVIYWFLLLISILFSGIIFILGNSIFKSIIFFITAYIILNILKEVFIYIAIGKKISWNWIKYTPAKSYIELDTKTAAALIVRMFIKHENPYSNECAFSVRLHNIPFITPNSMLPHLIFCTRNYNH